MNADPPVTTLIDLVRSVTEPDFRLILRGGFGLYLKQLHLQRQSAIRTLLPGELWPYPRATEDLDAFIPTEFLVNFDSMRILLAALDRLGFVPGREVFAFREALAKLGSCENRHANRTPDRHGDAGDRCSLEALPQRPWNCPTVTRFMFF
jgi:hypothetical protein